MPSIKFCIVIGAGDPKISTAFQTLQVYTASQLQALLEKNGFEVMSQTDIEGTKVNLFTAERILTVAKKTEYLDG